MGIAIADHRVADEIASAADASDLGQALEILQIPTQDVDPTSSVTAPVATQPGAAGPQSTEKVWHVKGYVSKPRVASTPPCEAASEILATIDYSEGWTGKGWGQGASQLETGARVTAPASCPRLGFVGPTIPLEYGGLLEVTVEIDDAPASGARPLLQIQSTDGVGIGHDFELNQGATTVRAFAPHSTKVIKFYVVMLDAPAGASFTMGRLVVRRIDTDDHCRRIRAKVGEPVLASLASIPSRESMLRDCVNSLLAQCDKVRVFLNSYPHVPGFLEHPRIEIRRSQDWDDRGDAGKFFWIDRDNEVPGYRVIADDDLIFPPDFVEVLAGKVAATGKRAIFATHGVLLRQPFARYYDRSARAATFHFSNALSVDRGIHISATGAMCFHSSTIDMGWGDFKYSNSADTWVTLYTQNNKIAAFTPARPRNWLRENEHAVPSDTIYRHSLNRTKSRFDSSHIQDAVLRHAWPLTVNTLSRPKVAVAVHLNHPSDLASSVGPWLKKASAIADRAEPVFVLSFYGGNDSLKAAIDQQPIPYETHLIDCSHARADPLAKVLALHVRLGFDATLLGAEKVQPVAHPQDNDAEDSVVLSTEPPISLGPAQITAWQRPHADRPCAIAVSGGEKGNDGLACLLGKGCRLRSSHQNNSAADDAFHLAGHNLRERVENAMAEGRRSAARPRHARPPTQIRTVNDLFQRVVVLNLDRRPERWERVSAELAREGIKTERFSAVDGLNPAIAKEYEDYSRRPPHTVGPDLPEIRFATDLYMNYPSQMARVAHLEASTGRKAIASAGAWGYLRSYEAILERSLTEQDETLLVFDDDIVLHREFRARFEQAVSQLPPNWLIIQLGTLQYNWTHPWCQWQSPMLYRTNGAAIGSHAVGMRFEILPFLLDHTRRMDLPYDIGPLSAATRAFADRCFVIHPNLAIQSLDDSDIGTSDFQKTRSREEIAAVYRWNLSDYRSQENADPS
ncbi:MAG: glycosyltransferase family 25 protein [Hyphomicrobiaceae bacterium]